MSKKRFNPREKKSFKRELKDLKDHPKKRGRNIVFSFRDFDRSQGQDFYQWQDEKLLALALDKLSQLSQFTIQEAQQRQLLKIYTKTEFPPKSGFKYPKYLNEGVLWASFHVQGKECIIGHIEEEVFFIVFLDKDHEFWITEKKHT